MKTVPIASLAFVLIILFGGSLQAQNPANFHLIYGNRDASPFVVEPGDTIDLPVWVATSPDPFSPDSVTFMHNPLASRDLYIPQRLGGYCVNCDSCCNFPLPNSMGGGYTNQSMLFNFYHPGIYTRGDTILIGYFRMRVTSDSAYSGQTINAFVEGHSNTIGYTLWGMQDGVRGVVPTITYSQLYFTPCFYTCGDANGDALFDGRDITYAINYFKGIGGEPPYTCDCPGNGSPRLAADSNGDCQFSGIDVTYSVNYLKGRGPGPRRCPRC